MLQLLCTLKSIGTNVFAQYAAVEVAEVALVEYAAAQVVEVTDWSSTQPLRLWKCPI